MFEEEFQNISSERILNSTNFEQAVIFVTKIEKPEDIYLDEGLEDLIESVSS